MSLNSRILKLEQAFGIRRSMPANKATDEEMLAELEKIWNKTVAEIPGWIKRLRSGAVTLQVNRVAWSPVVQFRFEENDASCLMSLSSALYSYFRGRRFPENRPGAPHAKDGEKIPSTPEEVADLLKRKPYDFIELITESRFIVTSIRARQGYPPEASWWNN